MKTETRTAIILFVSAFAFVSTLSALSLPQAAGELYEQALYTEEAEGDLEGAIALYRRILDQFSEDREIAAKAQLHIGLCYERLGMREAEKAYQGVLERYPEQRSEVTLAREGLTRLSKIKDESPQTPQFRELSVPIKISQGARLSPDGESLTFSSGLYEGSLWSAPVPGHVSPDIVGEPVKLAGEGHVWVWGHAWSADGKWIAYNFMSNEQDVFVDEIHVIPASGGVPRRFPVPVNRGGGFHLLQYSLSLSPDGKVLAYASREADESGGPQSSHVYTVSVDGGSARELTEARTWIPSFSPDGEKIAYVKAYGSTAEQTGSDLWVIPATGGTPIQISDLGGNVWDSVWSPDSRMVAFLREPVPDQGSREIWIVPVAESGAPEASPVKFDLPLDSVMRLAGWTSDNTIGLVLQNPVHQAIYTVPSSGGKATQVTPVSANHPSWSPDGDRLHFRMAGSFSSSAAQGGEVSVVSMRGDLETDWFYSSVSPDGDRIVFPAGEKGSRTQADLWIVSSDGGDPIKITSSPGTDVFPSWSPDSRWIVFSRQQRKSADETTYQTDLFVVSAEGGEPRQLTFSPDEVERTSTWAPDGQRIAYAGPNGRVMILPFEGGEPQMLVGRSAGGGLSWSPDGQQIAYAEQESILAISPEGGEPQEIQTGVEGRVGHIAWSPDGGKIAFVARTGGDFQLYLMERFLPFVKK